MILLALSGCSGSPPASSQTRSTEPSTPASPQKAPSIGIDYGYTHQQPDGNRYVVGLGNMPNAETLDIKLSGTPRWLVAAPLGAGSVWVAVLEDGTTEAFLVEGGRAVATAFNLRSLPAGSPPMLAVSEGEIELLTSRSDLAARFSQDTRIFSKSNAFCTFQGC